MRKKNHNWTETQSRACVHTKQNAVSAKAAWICIIWTCALFFLDHTYCILTPATLLFVQEATVRRCESINQSCIIQLSIHPNDRQLLCFARKSSNFTRNIKCWICSDAVRTVLVLYLHICAEIRLLYSTLRRLLPNNVDTSDF